MNWLNRLFCWELMSIELQRGHLMMTLVMWRRLWENDKLILFNRTVEQFKTDGWGIPLLGTHF